MKLPISAFVTIWLSLFIPQNVSSTKPCKIVYLNDRHVFTFSETSKQLLIQAQLEKDDHRPCSLSVKKPHEEELIRFELKTPTKREKTENNQNITVEVKYLAEKWILKVRIYQDDKSNTLRGKYMISNLTFFAFPRQPAENEVEYLNVDNLTCQDDTLHGRVNLTEDFHMCCEYHRFINPPMSKDINCCEECILIENGVNLNHKVNYNESYMEFAVKAQRDDQPSPLSISCTIQSEGILELTMKFKASAYKATPPCGFANFQAASVGLAAGLGLVLIACVTTIYFWQKSRRKAKLSDSKLNNLMAPPDMPEWTKPFSYPRGYLKMENEIGTGGFGVVIKAQAQNTGLSGDSVEGCNTVAVKTFRGGGESLDELMKEGELMSKMSFHYNIINLLGVSQDTPEKGHRLLLILDFCSRGSLDVILKEKQTEIKQNPELVETQDFNMKLLVAWTYQIAMGMKFLASHSIIHGDLAARNILIDEDNAAKISDFGKAHRVRYDNIGVEVKGKQPTWWMAPEAVKNQAVTMESDKWSFGVTVWEIFSLGEEPYSDRMVFDGLLEDLLSGLRMPLPERCPTQIYKQVILTCWKADKEKRPSWSELIGILHKMVDSKYLERYNIMQAKKRNNYSEMRNKYSEIGKLEEDKVNYVNSA